MCCCSERCREYGSDSTVDEKGELVLIHSVGNRYMSLHSVHANSVILIQMIRRVGGANLKLQRNPVFDFCLGHCVSDVA